MDNGQNLLIACYIYSIGLGIWAFNLLVTV